MTCDQFPYDSILFLPYVSFTSNAIIIHTAYLLQLVLVEYRVAGERRLRIRLLADAAPAIPQLSPEVGGTSSVAGKYCRTSVVGTGHRFVPNFVPKLAEACPASSGIIRSLSSVATQPLFIAFNILLHSKLSTCVESYLGTRSVACDNLFIPRS